MDYATTMVIRALVSGLFHAGNIGEPTLLKIIEALDDAAETARGRGKLNDTADIRGLREAIARDGQISA